MQQSVDWYVGRKKNDLQWRTNGTFRVKKTYEAPIFEEYTLGIEAEQWVSMILPLEVSEEKLQGQYATISNKLNTKTDHDDTTPQCYCGHKCKICKKTRMEEKLFDMQNAYNFITKCKKIYLPHEIAKTLSDVQSVRRLVAFVLKMSLRNFQARTFMVSFFSQAFDEETEEDTVSMTISARIICAETAARGEECKDWYKGVCFFQATPFMLPCPHTTDKSYVHFENVLGVVRKKRKLRDTLKNFLALFSKEEFKDETFPEWTEQEKNDVDAKYGAWWQQFRNLKGGKICAVYVPSDVFGMQTDAQTIEDCVYAAIACLMRHDLLHTQETTRWRNALHHLTHQCFGPQYAIEGAQEPERLWVPSNTQRLINFFSRSARGACSVTSWMLGQLFSRVLARLLVQGITLCLTLEAAHRASGSVGNTSSRICIAGAASVIALAFTEFFLGRAQSASYTLIRDFSSYVFFDASLQSILVTIYTALAFLACICNDDMRTAPWEQVRNATAAGAHLALASSPVQSMGTVLNTWLCSGVLATMIRTQQWTEGVSVADVAVTATGVLVIPASVVTWSLLVEGRWTRGRALLATALLGIGFPLVDQNAVSLGRGANELLTRSLRGRSTLITTPLVQQRADEIITPIVRGRSNSTLITTPGSALITTPGSALITTPESALSTTPVFTLITGNEEVSANEHRRNVRVALKNEREQKRKERQRQEAQELQIAEREAATTTPYDKFRSQCQNVQHLLDDVSDMLLNNQSGVTILAPELLQPETGAECVEAVRILSENIGKNIVLIEKADNFKKFFGLGPDSRMEHLARKRALVDSICNEDMYIDNPIWWIYRSGNNNDIVRAHVQTRLSELIRRRPEVGWSTYRDAVIIGMQFARDVDTPSEVASAARSGLSYRDGDAYSALYRASVVVYAAQITFGMDRRTRHAAAARALFEVLHEVGTAQQLSAGMPWLLTSTDNENNVAETAAGILEHLPNDTIQQGQMTELLRPYLPQSQQQHTASCFPEFAVPDFAVPELAVRSNRALAGLFVASSLRSRLYRV